MTKVFLVDGHEGVIEGVESYLLTQGFSVVGKAVAEDSILDLVLESKADVLVINIMFHGKVDNTSDGIAFVNFFSKSHPEIPAIIFSQRDDELTIKSAYAAGAKSFVCKNSQTDELCKSIEKAAIGEVYYPPTTLLRLS